MRWKSEQSVKNPKSCKSDANINTIWMSKVMWPLLDCVVTWSILVLNITVCFINKWSTAPCLFLFIAVEMLFLRCSALITPTPCWWRTTEPATWSAPSVASSSVRTLMSGKCLKPNGGSFPNRLPVPRIVRYDELTAARS